MNKLQDYLPRNISRCGGDTLNGHEAKEIEDELYTTLRNQVSRNSPIKLPRPNFWNNLKTLCEYVEAEVNSLGQKEGWSPRSQAASRRLANIRRAVAELSQQRLVALLRHASASQLKIANNSGNSSIESIDWVKHDPSERIFYHSLITSLESFKNNVEWNIIQHGVGDLKIPDKVPKGTQQLDEFVEDEAIVDGGTPVLNFIEEDSEIVEEELDEEDRIARLEIESYPESINVDIKKDDSSNSETTVSNDNSENTSDEQMMRIRIIKDEGVMMDDKGNDLEIKSGDIHQLSLMFAQLLIESGIAEDATL